jgi:formylglycine-generating enzyme required for sulfatase activity
MKRTKPRAALEDRITALLLAGVRPAVPEVVNSIGMRLALIPPGRFRMGSPAGESNRNPDEIAHEVDITRAFYMGVFEVTQKQYRAVTGTNPSHFLKGGEDEDSVGSMATDDFPVDHVSWDDAVAFCKRLSDRPQEKQSGRVYRLPSEAEWEYACRAWTTSAYHFGRAVRRELANVSASDLGRPCPVGSYPPNAFGLYDMHGNATEWCADWYDEGYYEQSARIDPPGPAEGSSRVCRGGDYLAHGEILCRSASRQYSTPELRSSFVGFRAAMDVARQ